MHNKCIVFAGLKRIVIGSANLTEDALDSLNYENLVVLTDPMLVKFCIHNLIGPYMQ